MCGEIDMNNSKTFIFGIVVFVLLIIGGFAFFAPRTETTVNGTYKQALDLTKNYQPMECTCTVEAQ